MALRALIILVLITTPTVVGACTGISEKLTKEYTDLVRDHLVPPGGKPEPEIRLENRMRTKLINRWFDEDIDKRTRWFLTREFPLAIKAMFVRAVAWRKDAYNGGTEKLYQLSHEYLQRPNAEENDFLTLSAQLLRHAALAGHTKAKAEIQDHPGNLNPPDHMDVTLDEPYSGALANDHEAQNLVAGFYLVAPIFEDDITKGYYWLLRGSARPPSAYMIRLLKRGLACVTEIHRKLAEAWLASGHVPPM